MPLETETCEDAASLVTALRPTESFLRREPRRLVYRGQSDAIWRLISTAFRTGARFPSEFGWVTVEDRQRDFPKLGREFAQALVEYETLAAFFRVADESGLALPEDSQIIRDKLGREIFDETAWPDLELRSILALAQHHGLPTRLLDWTWDWRVAAYFAARDAIERNTEHLAVWRLDAHDLRLHQRFADAFPNQAKAISATSRHGAWLH